jgi:hypothetical protein
MFSKVYYHTEYQGPEFSGHDIVPTSGVCPIPMYVLLTVGIKKHKGAVASIDMIFISSSIKFHQRTHKPDAVRLPFLNSYRNVTLRYQIKEDEMGGSCTMHGGDEKCIQNFGRKT